MNAQWIQKKLEDMKNKSFEYAKQKHIVQSYVISLEKETFEMKTNLNQFTRKFESASKFFTMWMEDKANLPVRQVENEIAESEVMPIPEKDIKLSENLVDILMDSIKKVKTQPGYIPQANAISKNVDGILKIQRLKIDMVKQMKKAKN